MKKINKFISILISLTIVVPCFSTKQRVKAASTIEVAIEWALSIADDDSHGYDQTSRWGPDYDCASLVISAFKYAGADVGGATYTGNMCSELGSHGFDIIDFSSSQLQRGDILWRRSNGSGHTELYIGNNQSVGAHCNEFGGVTGGKTGDQTGKEINVQNCGTNWMKIIRYRDNSPQYYTVYLNANGGDVSPGSLTVQSGGTYSGLPTPSRSGYDFAGWFDEGGRQVWDGLGIYTNGDHTLYAHWNPHKHNVWLNANGGEVNPGVIEVYTDGVYSGLPSPGRYGYDFAGWFDDSGRQVWDGLGIYTNAEHTLSAHWSPKSIKVNLNANGGSVSPDSIQVNFDDKYNNLPSAERTGYNFNGWFTALNGGTQIDFNSVCNTIDEHTLYAHWSKTHLMITFNAMGGTVETANKIVIYDNKYGVLPVPERKGYEFKGWYLEEGYTNLINSTSTVTITSNQDIYAKWEMIKYYITFDANGGILDISSKQVTAEKKYGVLPEPIKADNRFLGWYNTDDVKIVSSDTVELSEDTIFYAKWQLIGDINSDDSVNIADAVRLQKYLLGQEKISYNEYLAGDMNDDGSTDVFDMVLIRQKLIKE